MDVNYMKISEFAQATGITRRNLLFYDKIGLLSPTMIDEHNSYRYYTLHQIDTANVITVMREIGMPLKGIKAYLSERSPENLIQLLEIQKKAVQEKIETLIQISDMMNTRIAIIEEGLRADMHINSIVLKECDQVPIFSGPELPADSHISEGWYYIIEFYKFCKEHQVIHGLPTGAIISHADLAQGNVSHPNRYYFRPVCASSYPHNAVKPKGFYVVGQEHTEYAKTHHLYSRLYQYIKEAELEICGDAYEEYLLDEISTTDPTQYLLQVSIHVRT